MKRGSIFHFIYNHFKRDVKNWMQLPADGTVYKIINIEKKQGKFGYCYILNIKNKVGKKVKFRLAPRKLQREVEVKANKPNPRDIYFCSLGKFGNLKGFKKYQLSILSTIHRV